MISTGVTIESSIQESGPVSGHCKFESHNYIIVKPLKNIDLLYKYIPCIKIMNVELIE